MTRRPARRPARRSTRWYLCLLILPLLANCAPRGASISRPPGTLPAYAHNDYQNRHPLQDALRLGYSGVEADYFLVDGELLVAHERDETRADRTLRSMYLEPLRQLVADSGWVCSDGQSFILNIEAKESGRESFNALHEMLLEYQDMLTHVDQGQEIPGPVQVILVGWFPPLEELAAMPVRCVAVQAYYRELPLGHAQIPSHLLRLLSVQYQRHFAWRGIGPVPREFEAHLAELTAARDAVPGRMLRVFKVPRHSAVYDALQKGGVDFIGTKKLSSSARLLAPRLLLDY